MEACGLADARLLSLGHDEKALGVVLRQQVPAAGPEDCGVAAWQALYQPAALALRHAMGTKSGLTHAPAVAGSCCRACSQRAGKCACRLHVLREQQRAAVGVQHRQPDLPRSVVDHTRHQRSCRLLLSRQPALGRLLVARCASRSGRHWGLAEVAGLALSSAHPRAKQLWGNLVAAACAPRCSPRGRDTAGHKAAGAGCAFPVSWLEFEGAVQLSWRPRMQGSIVATHHHFAQAQSTQRSSAIASHAQPCHQPHSAWLPLPLRCYLGQQQHAGSVWQPGNQWRQQKGGEAALGGALWGVGGEPPQAAIAEFSPPLPNTRC